MGVFDKKRKGTTIRTNWFKLASGPRPRAFWLKVGKEVAARRVSRSDMGNVRIIVREVEQGWKGRT